MRMRTKSACVVLALGFLLAVLLAAGRSGPFSRPQANISMTRTTEFIAISNPTGAAAAVTAAPRGLARYVVQPGDTLAGIAARFDVRGGWPALYAANRPVIGPDPDVIDPGVVLALPGHAAVTRYTVAAGDTLSGIAAGLAVRGGWPALYAANRRAIGPDAGLIRPGTVLTVPGQAASSPAPSRPAPPARQPTPPTTKPKRTKPTTTGPTPGGHAHHRRPSRLGAMAASGLPSWLKTVLLAAGVVIGVAFLVEPVLVAWRRLRAARRAAAPAGGSSGIEPEPAAGRQTQDAAGVVMADYHRIVVSYDERQDTACVLRPPGEDPRAIMNVARLVLPESRYAELAGRLSLPATWPIVVADYDRIVVTCSKHDDTAYVLRPPGEDPRAVLRAARLVLPEGAYAELADQLGVPAGWPMEQR
ncbi:MAG TPA: LysM domain-containing protein [Streptosporangiaceae bacterium]|nr:LysM domain-containing protein [Streptosporangiaceae bacterium]